MDNFSLELIQNTAWNIELMKTYYLWCSADTNTRVKYFHI